MAYQKTKGMAFRVLKTNRSAGVLQRVYAGAQKQKSPLLRGLRSVLLLLRAGCCQTLNHSHSIVAGGLPEIS